MYGIHLSYFDLYYTKLLDKGPDGRIHVGDTLNVVWVAPAAIYITGYEFSD
jgi:hypothetical protein